MNSLWRLYLFSSAALSRQRTIATSILQIFASEGLRKPVPKAVSNTPSGINTVDVDWTLQNHAELPVMLPVHLAKI
jgi:hypothetical protein